MFVFVCLFYSFVFHLQHGGGQTGEVILTDILLSFAFVFNLYIFVLCFTCSMEAGRPGRPMEEETLGAVK